MRKSLAFLGCLAIVALPVFIGTASANYADNGMNNSTTTTTTSDYGNTLNGGNTVYTGAGSQEYVVNPTEMTSTRDNRGDIPQGVHPSSARYYRSSDNNANGGNPNWNNSSPNSYNSTR